MRRADSSQGGAIFEGGSGAAYYIPCALPATAFLIWAARADAVLVISVMCSLTPDCMFATDCCTLAEALATLLGIVCPHTWWVTLPRALNASPMRLLIFPRVV